MAGVEVFYPKKSFESIEKFHIVLIWKAIYVKHFHLMPNNFSIKAV